MTHKTIFLSHYIGRRLVATFDHKFGDKEVVSFISSDFDEMFENLPKHDTNYTKNTRYFFVFERGVEANSHFLHARIYATPIGFYEATTAMRYGFMIKPISDKFKELELRLVGDTNRHGMIELGKLEVRRSKDGEVVDVEPNLIMHENGKYVVLKKVI